MSIQLSSNKRPISALWGSPLEMALDLCALIALALTIVFAVNAWPMLPETIPTHFDFSGQADSFGGKWMIFLLPAVSLVFYIGFSALRRVPHLYNYIWPITPQNAQRQYELARLLMSWFKLEVLALFAYLEWANVQAALNQTNRLDMTFLPVVLLVVFGTLVSYLYRAYRALTAMNFSRGLSYLDAMLRALPSESSRYIVREAWRIERALPHWFDVLPLPRLMKLLEVEASRYRFEADAACVTQLVDAIVGLDYFSPLGICLRRSLVRYVLLRRAHVPVVIHFGAKKKGRDTQSKIAGHAWLTLDGQPFAEKLEDYQGFTPIYSYPSTPVTRHPSPVT